MKKLLLMLFLAMTCASSFAQYTTTDYMYTEGIGYDEEEEYSYFDVYLKGENIYTAYGVDIQLPLGYQVVESENEPLVYMLDSDFIDDVIYPKTNRKYTHSLSLNFIDNQSHIRVGCNSSTNKNLLGTSGGLFRVYIEKKGDVTWPLGAIKFYSAKFVKDTNEGYAMNDRENIVVVNSEEVSLPLNVNGTYHWSTCVLPFSANLPEGVTAYTCKAKEENKVLLSPAESIEAYTPYILYSENGFAGTFTGNVDAANLPESGFVCKDGLLNGAIVAQQITEGYVLQNLDEGVKFYNCGGDTFSIPAGKCWLNKDAGGSAKSVVFEIEDPTGIKEVDSNSAGESVYTLDGKKVLTPQTNGLYIKVGKKFINK